MFARKADLSILYSLWDYIIVEGDSLYFSYFYIVLLVTSRQIILKENASNIPERLCNIKIKTKAELESIICLANALREQTPISFQLWIKRLGFLNYNTPKEIIRSSLSELEKCQRRRFIYAI